MTIASGYRVKRFLINCEKTNEFVYILEQKTHKVQVRLIITSIVRFRIILTAIQTTPCGYTYKLVGKLKYRY